MLVKIIFLHQIEHTTHLPHKFLIIHVGCHYLNFVHDVKIKTGASQKDSKLVICTHPASFGS